MSEGRTYYSKTFLKLKDSLLRDPQSASKILTSREQNVVRLLARGLDNQELSVELGITPKTAQTHRSNILRRIGVVSTAKLVAWAQERGFGRLR